MALYVGVVTFLLLFFAFGSVVLPLKAILMNVVSIGASFGVVVWIFQDGHLADWLGFTSTGFLEPTNLILMLAILFGLSTDYEVFLLSRVREEWDRTGDNTEAVTAGLQRTGGIITAAALLLIVVIGGFATGGATTIKMLGIGTVVAVAVDAALVRTLLVPGHHAAARPVELVGARTAGPGLPPLRHPRVAGPHPGTGARRQAVGCGRGGVRDGAAHRPAVDAQRRRPRPDLRHLLRWEVARWLGATPKVLASRDEAAAVVDRWAARSEPDPRFGVWAVEVRDSGVVAGTVLLVRCPLRLRTRPTRRSRSAGTCTRTRGATGTRPRPAAGAIAHGFDGGLSEIYAVVRPDNERSLAVCRRLGMSAAGPYDALVRHRAGGVPHHPPRRP